MVVARYSAFCYIESQRLVLSPARDGTYLRGVRVPNSITLFVLPYVVGLDRRIKDEAVERADTDEIAVAPTVCKDALSGRK